MGSIVKSIHVSTHCRRTQDPSTFVSSPIRMRITPLCLMGRARPHSPPVRILKQSSSRSLSFDWSANRIRSCPVYLILCRMEMHFLSEKERRELNAQRRDERDKVSSSPDCHLEQTREPCAYVGREEDAKGARYSHSEWRYVTCMRMDGSFPSRRRCVRSWFVSCGSVLLCPRVMQLIFWTCHWYDLCPRMNE